MVPSGDAQGNTAIQVRRSDRQRMELWDVPKPAAMVPLEAKDKIIYTNADGEAEERSVVCLNSKNRGSMVRLATEMVRASSMKANRIENLKTAQRPNWFRDDFYNQAKDGQRAQRWRSGMLDQRYLPEHKKKKNASKQWRPFGEYRKRYRHRPWEQNPDKIWLFKREFARKARDPWLARRRDVEIPRPKAPG
uniref:Uncharacterized protein n=1 Tax=Zooxanthella nutricula TaxID=1333877 RepID=A0A7S2JN43_9DINO